MSQSIINDSTLTAIADAINAKAGTSGKMLPSAMADKIAAIHTGGGWQWVKPDDWPDLHDIIAQHSDDNYPNAIICLYRDISGVTIPTTVSTKVRKFITSDNGVYENVTSIITHYFSNPNGYNWVIMMGYAGEIITNSVFPIGFTDHENGCDALWIVGNGRSICYANYRRNSSIECIDLDTVHNLYGNRLFALEYVKVKKVESFVLQACFYCESDREGPLKAVDIDDVADIYKQQGLYDSNFFYGNDIRRMPSFLHLLKVFGSNNRSLLLDGFNCEVDFAKVKLDGTISLKRIIPKNLEYHEGNVDASYAYAQNLNLNPNSTLVKIERSSVKRVIGGRTIKISGSMQGFFNRSLLLEELPDVDFSEVTSVNSLCYLENNTSGLKKLPDFIDLGKITSANDQYNWMFRQSFLERLPRKIISNWTIQFAHATRVSKDSVATFDESGNVDGGFVYGLQSWDGISVDGEGNRIYQDMCPNNGQSVVLNTTIRNMFSSAEQASIAAHLLNKNWNISW